jgi:5-formyltetrahydrofolate cyclo-ligase
MDATKNELRRKMRLRLQSSGDRTAEWSRAIVASIAGHPAWAGVRVLSLYSALPGEPDLSALWTAETPPRFCYPRIEAGGMTFFEVKSPGELIPAPWHPTIREPVFTPARLVPPEQIDLILVPGLAFTRAGQRLGRGGGFYDRYLAALPTRAIKLGVCFQCQIEENLPLEAHDQRVHAIITESGLTGILPTEVV